MTSFQRFTASVTLLTTAFSLGAQVKWQAWGEAAQAEAADRAVPLYLVIGDPLSELSSSMRRDTFANPEVAAFLNEKFVCVYADRDSLPGIAAYGQQWLAAEQKIPGWPLNLWFTPDLEPIEGASYLPPTEEWGREGFMVVANRVTDKWTAGPEAVVGAAHRRQELIADYLPFAAEPVPDMSAALAEAAAEWVALINPETGVFGEPPHRPEPELLRFLIGQGGAARDAALGALRQRLATALRDPIDGGFYRGTVDTLSSIPVFQKRLTDQARLALACLDAAQHSDDPAFAAGARSALDYIINQLGQDDGTFWVGDDITNPDQAERHTWTESALIDAVGKAAATSFGATKAGNVDPEEDFEGAFIGRNILHQDPVAGSTAAMVEARQSLLALRTAMQETRVKNTATAGAHGLVLHALRRAAAELEDAAPYGARADLTETVLNQTFGVADGMLVRVAGSTLSGTPEDYMLVALGMDMLSIAQHADEQFYDDEFGLYYATSEEVMGILPLMWPTSPGELPAPAVWRLMIGNPPDLLAAEVAAPFDNPDAPPPGDVLLALQQHHTSE